MNRAKILQIEQFKRREGKTSNCIIVNIFFVLVELQSVSDKRQREIDTLQETITLFTLQLKERDGQIEELKQSLKGIHTVKINISF